MAGEVFSRSLEGISDLTLVAPIRPGLVADAFAPASYAARLRAVLGALRALRTSAREAAAIRPFTDVVERIESIHSFRLALLPSDPADPLAPGRLLLAVTFDRGWEPYVRLLWVDLGPFLDLIFCNCAGYVRACDSTLADYAAWIRRSQIDSPYFYVDSARSLGDGAYGVAIERLAREGCDGVDLDTALAGCVPVDPVARAATMRRAAPAAAARIWLEALAGLYRLTALYRPGTADGDLLHRAARDLLREGDEPPAVRPPADTPGLERFAAALGWLGPAAPPARPADPPTPAALDAVQRGIVRSHDESDPAHPISHGAVLLLRVMQAERARAWLGEVAVQAEGDAPLPPGQVYATVAFTATGLRRLGVGQATLDAFPPAFRQGMAARAGQLGDVRAHHPGQWRTPRHAGGAGKGARIDLSLVDIAIVLRVSAAVSPGDAAIEGNPAHPLHGWIAALDEAQAGVALLAIEPALRRDPAGQPINHFGFADGLSQPVVDGGDGTVWSDRAALGDIVCGHPHSRGSDVPPANAWLDGGSFLVVRKIGQNMAAAAALDGHMEKIVGRRRDGAPLCPAGAPGGPNDFDYADDPAGVHCPLQSHVRRANPRVVGAGGGGPPRIMRRGLSYGPPHRADEPGDTERGLLFMAYCGDIAEQYETIQRWVSGGNSTRLPAIQSDPLLGVPQAGDGRVFRYVQDGAVRRVPLDHPARPALTRLEWGAYFFVPSIETLRRRIAHAPGVTRAGEKPVAGASGAADWARTLALMPRADDAAAREAWSTLFADAEQANDTAGLWAAIRARPGGVLRTPLGVIVAAPDQVMASFADRERRYSVAGYRERMAQSFGEIYLGVDAGARYDAEAGATNAAIGAIRKAAAFDAADQAAGGILHMLSAGAARAEPPRLRIDLRGDFIDTLLEQLARLYFGIPALDEGRAIEPGGWSWQPAGERRPRCPGDFIQPSAHLFYPLVSDAVTEDGTSQGRALRAAAMAHVEAHRAKPTGLIAQPMFAAIPDDDLLARTLIGAMIGFIPTVSGNLASVLQKWIASGTFWRLQEDLRGGGRETRFERARRVLLPAMTAAMQAAPTPPKVWRRCTHAHRLGDETIWPGETVTIAIASATQAKAAAGDGDLSPMFGGRRGPGGPTHACPGYEMAIGTMLGALAALLDAGEFRTDGTPLALTLLGEA